VKLDDFHIGREFWTETGPWRCTDVGARTICAIKLGPVDIVGIDGEGTERRRRENDPKLLEGPPYGVGENVFDEFEGLCPSEEALKKGENTWCEIHETYYDAQGRIDERYRPPHFCLAVSGIGKLRSRQPRNARPRYI
jgi:hypothetical protein